MEKVKLRREVAETIDRAIRDYASKTHIVRNKACQNVFPETYDLLNILDLDILIRALYIGYVVEETPEDKVREYYSKLTVKAKEKDDWDKFGVNLYRSEMQGIINSLKLLNIKINGVND